MIIYIVLLIIDSLYSIGYELIDLLSVKVYHDIKDWTRYILYTVYVRVRHKNNTVLESHVCGDNIKLLSKCFNLPVFRRLKLYLL